MMLITKTSVTEQLHLRRTRLSSKPARDQSTCCVCTPACLIQSKQTESIRIKARAEFHAGQTGQEAGRAPQGRAGRRGQGRAQGRDCMAEQTQDAGNAEQVRSRHL